AVKTRIRHADRVRNVYNFGVSKEIHNSLLAQSHVSILHRILHIAITIASTAAHTQLFIMVNSIAVAEVVVYAALLPVSIYLCSKHYQHHAWLGWSYLVAFESLRIAGAAVTLAKDGERYNDG